MNAEKSEKSFISSILKGEKRRKINRVSQEFSINFIRKSSEKRFGIYRKY